MTAVDGIAADRQPWLHHTPLPPPQRTTHTALLLHGILGQGRNLRTFGAVLARAVPGLAVVTVDLRGHGQSHGFAPPHTVAACAADVEALALHLGLTDWSAVGHSFGGKAALALAAHQPVPGLRRVVVLDAVPGPRTGDGTEADVEALVRALHAAPVRFGDRAGLERFLRERGQPPDVSAWMATNLRSTPAGFELVMDLAVVDPLLADYFTQDLWPVVERLPQGVRVQFVRAGRSERWTPAILARLAATPARVDVLADAGHWLHADDPAGLAGLVANGFKVGGDS